MKKRDLPAPFAEIEARQMEMDRSYFEQHPNATEYERAYISPASSGPPIGT
jgi:hypothetical protein